MRRPRLPAREMDLLHVCRDGSQHHGGHCRRINRRPHTSEVRRGCYKWQRDASAALCEIKRRSQMAAGDRSSLREEPGPISGSCLCSKCGPVVPAVVPNLSLMALPLPQLPIPSSVSVAECHFRSCTVLIVLPAGRQMLAFV